MDSLVVDSFTNLDPFKSSSIDLGRLGQKWKFHVTVVLEFRVRLVGRVNEMLNFSHLELSDSQKSVPRSDFVTETQTNLGRGKRHSSTVVFQQFAEVNEDSLSGFRSQETHQLSIGTNRSLEHKVERLGLSQFIVGFGCFNFEGVEGISHLLLFHTIGLEQIVVKLLDLFGGKFSLFLTEFVLDELSIRLRLVTSQRSLSAR